MPRRIVDVGGPASALGLELARVWLDGVAVAPPIAAALATGASAADRAAAARHLQEVAIDLPDNRRLRIELRQLRNAGHIDLTSARRLAAAAGKLSAAEQQAIGETLLAATIAPEAAALLRAHLADERLARAHDQRGAAISSGAFTALSLASGGMTAAAATVFAGLSFGAEPLATTIIAFTTLFGLGSVVGCANIAANRAVEATRYGRDD